MALPPHKFREIVFQLLYSHDFHREEGFSHLSELLMGELEVTQKNMLLAVTRTEALLACLPEIDAIVAKVSTSYALERLHSVERNVLRLAVFELCFEKLLPTAVVIAEAKRLAHKFSGPEAAIFVHALLGTVAKGM
jgi:N utilization substance protein B